MSTISETISRVRSTPLRIVLRKGLHKLQSGITKPFKRWNAVRKPSYSITTTLPNVPLRSLLKVPPVATLNPYRSILKNITRVYLQHKFEVLGSGWVENKHGISCIGVRGFVYKPSDTDFTIDIHGDWIDYVIRKVNAPASKQIWQLIDFPYTPIDWQRDIKSGFSWSEDTWYKDITIGYGKGIDAKVPWELGRMHHLLHFALAHYTESDNDVKQQIQREYRNIVLDFIALNPPQFGIQWKSSMDVAIRISNILVSYDLFKAQGVLFDDDFSNIIKHCAYEHGKHVYENLEWSEGMRGNHYLANICGLCISAMYLPPTDEHQLWFEFSFKELCNEILYQFNTDGSNFEASIPYHRLSTEMIVWSVALIKKSHTELQFPQDVTDRLHSIKNFTESYCYSSGIAPQFGDNDSGRFLPLLPFVELGTVRNASDNNNHSNLLCGLKVLFGEQSLQNDHPEQIILTELIGSNSFQKPTPKPTIAPTFVYPLNNLSFEMRLRAGEIGQHGKGGHTHNDQLSFTLAVRGKEIFVDTGTYLYSPLPEERNRFRSTAQHNTLHIIGQEQNTWNIGTLDSLFWLHEDKTKTEVLHYNESGWVGIHYGYTSPHKRTVTMSDTIVTITDECTISTEKHVHFHLNPLCNVEYINDNAVKVQLGTIEVEVVSDDNPIRIRQSLFSHGYGYCEDSHCLTIITEKNTIVSHIRLIKSELP